LRCVGKEWIEMKQKRKVVFEDGDRTKIAIGNVTFEEGFVKVTDDTGKTILINKSNVVMIRDGDY